MPAVAVQRDPDPNQEQERRVACNRGGQIAEAHVVEAALQRRGGECESRKSGERKDQRDDEARVASRDEAPAHVLERLAPRPG